MLMDWKNKYCYNVNTTQSNLHIQCNPNQNYISILLKVRANNPKICMEPQKTWNSPSNSKEENQSGGITIHL
uniref:Uncharacterized protein n=1 Tax=Suricata suricatta TaxID=37032 RepID=A0A673V4G7_SURSU